MPLTSQDTAVSSPLIIFYLMLLYLPFQIYLPDTSVGMGINLLNILLLILIFATSVSDNDLTYSSYKRFKILILFFMLYTLASAVINNAHGSFGDALIAWKRVFFIPVLFFITYNLLKNEKQILTTVGVISFITVLSSVQVLRNTFSYRNAHYNHSMRYGGMFGPGGENDLAAFLAINFFWFLFWSQQASARWKKNAFLAMAALVGTACLFCYSRGAYLAITAGALYYGWKKYRLILVVLAVMLVTVPAWAPQTVRERVEMLTHDEKLESDSSAQSRLVIWEGAQKMIAANLMFGVGFNNFALHIRNYAQLPETSPTASHNMYLKMWAELGLPGLLFFLLILVNFFKAGYRLSQETVGWQSTWATAFTASVIALIVVNYFGDRFLREELTGYLWVLAAIAFKLRCLTRSQREVCSTPEHSWTLGAPPASEIRPA